MKYVVLAVFPIRKGLCIGTGADYWLFFCFCLFHELFLWLNLKIFVCVIAGGSCIHVVGIDDFRFFFEIECFSIFDDNSVLELILEILLVARAHAFGIGVPDKLISASCFPATLVPSEGS